MYALFKNGKQTDICANSEYEVFERAKSEGFVITKQSQPKYIAYIATHRLKEGYTIEEVKE